jgi:hypothetical protein
MWLRIRRPGKIHWFNLDQLALVTLDQDQEFAVKLYSSSGLGLLISSAPGVEFALFDDDWVAIQEMLEDIGRMPVHPAMEATG